jgi:hypothetical protein
MKSFITKNDCSLCGTVKLGRRHGTAFWQDGSLRKLKYVTVKVVEGASKPVL